LASVKEAVFCNFDLAYLPCRLHPPIFPVTRRVTRKAGYSTEMSLSKEEQIEIILLAGCQWYRAGFVNQEIIFPIYGDF
jgi:hypothetical protein